MDYQVIGVLKSDRNILADGSVRLTELKLCFQIFRYIRRCSKYTASKGVRHSIKNSEQNFYKYVKAIQSKYCLKYSELRQLVSFSQLPIKKLQKQFCYLCMSVTKLCLHTLTLTLVKVDFHSTYFTYFIYTSLTWLDCSFFLT